MELINIHNDVNRLVNLGMTYESVYKTLLKYHPENIVKYTMFHLYKYKHNTEISNIITDELHFKKEVAKIYDNKCVVTGADIMVCDVYCIIPLSQYIDNDKYDVNNGILLRIDLHKLFDTKDMKINPKSLRLELSDKILNNKNMSMYHGLQGQVLDIKDKTIVFVEKIY